MDVTDKTRFTTLRTHFPYVSKDTKFAIMKQTKTVEQTGRMDLTLIAEFKLRIVIDIVTYLKVQ